MKWLLIIVGLIVLLIAAVALIGARLPEEHIASRAAAYHKTPAEVWAVVGDFKSYPAWRPEVKSVEILPGQNGLPSWRETDSHGNSIPYQVTEMHPPGGLTAVIADPELPFSGTWTWEIQPANGGGSSVRIREEGKVHNPFFRFVARFVLGYTKTMDQYLKALGTKFGEDVQPGN
jgi:uncharacterized protein YndB with AHSA1/START domain